MTKNETKLLLIIAKYVLWQINSLHRMGEFTSPNKLAEVIKDVENESK